MKRQTLTITLAMTYSAVASGFPCNQATHAISVFYCVLFTFTRNECAEVTVRNMFCANLCIVTLPIFAAS